jgi:hypothetical protein
MEHAHPYAPFDTQANEGDIASLPGLENTHHIRFKFASI